MDIILTTVKCQFELVYQDDVVIFSRSVEEHLDRVQYVLGLLLRASISLELKECFFIEDCIDNLGHVMQPGRHKISTKASNTIRKLDPSTNVTEIKSFHGLCNVFR